MRLSPHGAKVRVRRGESRIRINRIFRERFEWHAGMTRQRIRAVDIVRVFIVRKASSYVSLSQLMPSYYRAVTLPASSICLSSIGALSDYIGSFQIIRFRLHVINVIRTGWDIALESQSFRPLVFTVWMLTAVALPRIFGICLGRRDPLTLGCDTAHVVLTWLRVDLINVLFNL